MMKKKTYGISGVYKFNKPIKDYSNLDLGVSQLAILKDVYNRNNIDRRYNTTFVQGNTFAETMKGLGKSYVQSLKNSEQIQRYISHDKNYLIKGKEMYDLLTSKNLDKTYITFNETYDYPIFNKNGKYEIEFKHTKTKKQTKK